MRTSLGIQEWVWWLMTFGSAALTFAVRGPRMLWSVLLAAICGFCEAQIIFYDDMPAESAGRFVDWLVFLPPIILGGGYAWRQRGWSVFKAAWLGLLFGFVLIEGAALTEDAGGESEYAGQTFIITIVIGTILATVGAVFATALRVLARRLRHSGERHDDGVAAQEALLIGGPVDGRIMVIEEIGLIGLPSVLQLDQAGVLVGVTDQPSPRVAYAYARGPDIDGLPTYHHVAR